jgi:SHS2 domain-containing protein
MPFRFRDDIAGADAAFEAWGGTPEMLFESAAEALLAVMVLDTATVLVEKFRAVSLTAASLEMLLFRFLDELVYLKDAERLFLKVETLAISESMDGWSLTGIFGGEKIDTLRHETTVDIKAVTPYRFQVAKTDDRWRATVVVDV